LAEALAERLGLSGPLDHFVEALTHPSFSNEQRRRCADNQRLEFLGDAVLGLCVSELLMERFPASDEGELSLMRSSLVNTDALAAWAQTVSLGAALRLGRGADAAGERNQKNVLADAVEALVASVYLDRGIDTARGLSLAIVGEALARWQAGSQLGRDPKSELQERIQSGGGAAPRYAITGVEGPPHDRTFVVSVGVAGVELGSGRGRSKKLAEQAAARDALERVESGDAPPQVVVESTA
jgi:ribonuclease-3